MFFYMPGSLLWFYDVVISTGGGDMEADAKDLYRVVFTEYPDILDVMQVSAVLGVSKKTVYRLLREGSIVSLKVGREFRVPKVNVMRYMKIIGASVYKHTTV